MKVLILFLLISGQCFSITFNDWKELTDEERVTYISNSLSDIDISLEDKNIKYSRLTQDRQSLLMKKIEDTIEEVSTFGTELYTEVEDDMYAQVGGLEKSVDLYFSEDNHFLGAQIQYFQSGCSHMDANGEYVEGGGYYENVKEAEKNNCYDNDVSWSGYSIIDHQFKEMWYSDYMEWSGH